MTSIRLNDYSYYEVTFAHNTVYLIASRLKKKDFVVSFGSACGFQGFSGAIMNPKQYLSITEMKDVKPETLKRYRVLEDILI